MPKVYEAERGKPSKSFILFPSWRCNSCGKQRREPLQVKCFKCRANKAEVPQ